MHDLGPFRLIEELGVGSMGTVHLAEVREPAFGLRVGDRVAVKVMHPHLLGSAAARDRFLREAAHGMRVRNEHVVRVLGTGSAVREGTDTPCAYFAMEEVRGRTLRRLCAEMGVVPESLVREIGRQVARGLAAIHDAGIVHRDLKPENVMITHAHEVRIMDLGVARGSHGDEALTSVGTFVGTLLYAAPERFRPGAVAPASDLYSLGVLLHELAGGRNPFLRDEPSAVIQAHLTEEPPRLDDDGRVSAFLADLVDCLLRKRPEERLAATELAEVLGAGEASTWWTGRAHGGRARRGGTRFPIERTLPLRGRSEELARIRAAWHAARTGVGGVLVVEGEAGIGKTRLVAELLDDAADSAWTMYSAFVPHSGIEVLAEPVTDAIGAAAITDLLTAHLPGDADVVASFSRVLRQERSPELMRAEALVAMFCRLLRALASERPVLWAVDDLQFAGELSRRIVFSLCRAAKGHRALVVLTTRGPLPALDAAGLRLLECQSIRLLRLDRQVILALAAERLGTHLAGERAARVVAEASDGVPLFAAEMLREIQEKRLAESDDTQGGGDRLVRVEVPSAVRALVEGRLERLRPDERAVLDTASVQGCEFDPAVVASVRSESRIRTLELLADTQRRAGVVAAVGPRFRFDHRQIQEVVYAALPEDLRREYHAATAAAVAAGPGEPTGAQAFLVARHSLLGTRPRDAAPLLAEVLGELKNTYRVEPALELCDLALAAGPALSPDQQLEVLVVKAECLAVCGHRESERETLDRALALADSSADLRWRARTRRVLGWHLISESKFETAKRVLEDAIRFAREAGDGREEAIATGYLGVAHWNAGSYEEARQAHEAQESLSRAAGDLRGAAHAIGGLGLVAWSIGRHAEARGRLETQLAMSRELGDRGGEAIALLNLGNLLQDLGARGEAKSSFELSAAICREIGNPLGEGIALASLGSCHLYEGHFEAARQSYDRHLALTREVGSLRVQAASGSNLGFVLYKLGFLAEALRVSETSRIVASEIGARPALAAVLGNLGLFLTVLGALAEAREYLDRSRDLCREIGSPRDAGYALLRLAEVAWEEGDAASALRLCDEALVAWQAISFRTGTAEAMLRRGAWRLASGSADAGRADLRDALGTAEAIDEPETALLCRVHAAAAGEGDEEAARRAWRDHAGRVGWRARIECAHGLWRLTQDPGMLAEARSLLAHLVRNAPEDRRTTMQEGVRLHRAVLHGLR